MFTTKGRISAILLVVLLSFATASGAATRSTGRDGSFLDRVLGIGKRVVHSLDEIVFPRP
jgi:hypothetical protein